MKNAVYVIIGPTSSGKTSLALELCKRFNGEIISADSRQVVKHMDIGTGKMPVSSEYEVIKGDAVWKLDGVNIWGYDLTTPDEYYTGVDWARGALTRARRLYGQEKNIFVVGGTGFYIDLFTGNKKPAGVKPDYELRKTLETTPTKNLLTWLTSLNPAAVERLDTKNRVRIIRALEIELKKETENNPPLPYLKDTSIKLIGLTAKRAVLYSRTDFWAEEIWDGGLIPEVKKLISMGYGKTTKLNGLVYKSALAYIQEQESEKDALKKMKYDLHAYIRRQQTYFNKIPNISWFNIISDDFKEKIYTIVNG